MRWASGILCTAGKTEGFYEVNVVESKSFTHECHIQFPARVLFEMFNGVLLKNIERD